MHFPHDVLGGWLLGAAVLWGFARSEGRVGAWFAQRSLGARMGVGLLASLAMISLGHLVLAAVAPITDPPQWSDFAGAARQASHWYTLAGAGFGAVAGYSLMQRYAPFESSGAWGKRLARYAVGLAGLLVLYFGLDNAFAAVAADESTLGYWLRYVRYTVMALWAFFLAPWSFLKLGLAQRA
jgi:hypothetical protein